jgi:DNA-binding PadR family transcriptional regulator
MHGYDIKRTFDEKLGDFWNLNVGQIYATLDRLRDAGLVEYEAVEQADKPDKKVYRITEAGRAALDDWRATPAKHEPRALRDELFLKILFMDADGARALDDVLDQIAAQEGIYMAHMMQLTNRKFSIEGAARKGLANAADAETRQRLEHDRVVSTVLIEAALFHAEADINWLRHTRARLEALRSVPPG